MGTLTQKTQPNLTPKLKTAQGETQGKRSKSTLHVVWNTFAKTPQPKPNRTCSDYEAGIQLEDYNRYKVMRAVSLATPLVTAFSYGVQTIRNSPADIQNMNDLPTFAGVYICAVLLTLHAGNKVRAHEKETSEKPFDPQM